MTLLAPDTMPPAHPVQDEGSIRDFVREARAAYDLDNYDRTISVCERLLARYPVNAEALLLLGMTSWKMDEPAHAIDMLRRAQKADENTREYADALATVLAHLGDSTESLYFAKLATILAPHPFGDELLPRNFTEYFKNLNYARPHIYRTRARHALERGAYREARNLIEKQINLTPNDPETMRLGAQTFYESNQLARAVTAIEAAIEAGATATDHDQLARCFAKAGFFSAALESHDTAIALRPEDPALAQSRLRSLALQHGDGAAVPEFAAACHAWFAKFVPATDAVSFENVPEPERRLRIGYLGSGFHARGLAPMFEGILAMHDPQQYEIYIYASGTHQDMTTENLMRRCARWTDVTGIDPETTAHILRNDRIDIAVDLTGHGDNSQLQVFGHAPAPVRLGWLGVKPATPLAYDVDLLDADAPALPVDHPIVTANMPALAPKPPCVTNGLVTFGIIAPMSSLGPESFEIVAAILSTTANSRLLIANHERQDVETMARIHELIAAQDLTDRVTVAELEDTRAQRSGFFTYMDILIDPRPVSGFAEAAEALWCGVPILTLEHTSAGRALAAAGHDEWMFPDVAALATGAHALARDTDQLIRLRHNMRSEILGAPLYNWGGFVQSLEVCYRQNWERWCATQG